MENNLLERAADLVMDAGQIQQYDAPSRLLAHPATSFVERLVRRSRVFQTRA